MINLSYEMWENIFCENDVIIIFGKFLNRYLRIFYSSFTKRKIHNKPKGNTLDDDRYKDLMYSQKRSLSAL